MLATIIMNKSEPLTSSASGFQYSETDGARIRSESVMAF